MPLSAINKHAELCIEKTKLYVPVVIAVLGLFGSGISFIFQREFMVGTMLMSIGLIMSGVFTSIIFNEIKAVRWAHMQAVGIFSGDASLVHVLGFFPDMKKLLFISFSLIILGLVIGILPFFGSIYNYFYNSIITIIISLGGMI